MKVRQHPTNPAWFQIDIGYGKNRERLAYDGTYEDAVEFGTLRAAAKRPATATCFDRVTTLIDRYLDAYKIDHQAGGYRNQCKVAKHIRGFFGAMLVQNITVQKVEDYKQARIATGVKPVTVQKELCLLSGLFKWCVDMNLIDEPPCRIKKFRTKMIAPPEIRLPSREELESVVAEIPAKFRGLFALMLNYGLRTAEAFKLTANSYNIERQILAVTGKGGKVRYIPIVDEQTHLELKFRAENAKHGFLWYSVRSNGAFVDLRVQLQNATARAGVGDHVYNHLLRHGCFTELVGVADLKTVMALSGHAQLSTLQRYLTVRNERLVDAMKQHMGGKNKLSEA